MQSMRQLNIQKIKGLERFFIYPVLITEATKSLEQTRQ